MANEGQRYLNQSGLSALWNKIKDRDIALSGEISAVSTALGAHTTNLEISGVSGVSGVLGISAGGLGVTSWDAARDENHLDVYTKNQVNSLFNGQVVILTALPASGEAGKIYYIGPTGSGVDKYDEYIWDSNSNTFIHVGEHSIDLSNYVNTVTLTGTGNAVTTTAKNGNTLTLGKDQTFVPSSDYTATIAGMTTAYTAGTHKVITAINQSSGTITAVGEKQLGVEDIDGLTALSNDLSGHIDFVSGAVTALNDYVNTAIETLNNRITAASSNLNDAITALNSRVDTFSAETTAAFDAMYLTTAFSPWQTIVGLTSQSGKLSFSAEDIPAITKQEIDDLDNSWVTTP